MPFFVSKIILIISDDFPNVPYAGDNFPISPTVGQQGPQGTGVSGTQGFQGRQGYQGAQGFQGFQGLIGFQGWQGFQGLIGVQGFQGNQGFQGFQGFQDFTGQAAAGSVVILPTGATGPAGSHIGVQGWLTVTVNSITRYMPFW